MKMNLWNERLGFNPDSSRANYLTHLIFSFLTGKSEIIVFTLTGNSEN